MAIILISNVKAFILLLFVNVVWSNFLGVDADWLETAVRGPTSQNENIESRDGKEGKVQSKWIVPLYTKAKLEEVLRRGIEESWESTLKEVVTTAVDLLHEMIRLHGDRAILSLLGLLGITKDELGAKVGGDAIIKALETRDRRQALLESEGSRRQLEGEIMEDALRQRVLDVVLTRLGDVRGEGLYVKRAYYHEWHEGEEERLGVFIYRKLRNLHDVKIVDPCNPSFRGDHTIIDDAAFDFDAFFNAPYAKMTSYVEKYGRCVVAFAHVSCGSGDNHNPHQFIEQYIRGPICNPEHSHVLKLKFKP